jgi:ketosteroid isomerase-like protein
VDEALHDTFRRIYSALQRGDAEALASSLSHDIEWVLPDGVPWGGTHHGHLGVVAVLEIFVDHVDGLWADIDELLQADGQIVALGRVSGQGRQSGEEFEVPFAQVWTLSDGIPSRMRAYYDTAPITAALEAG